MNTDELVHLLRRTEYVAKPARVAALSGMTRAQAVDDILSVGASPAVPDYLLTDVSGQEYQQFVFATQWWLDRMVDGTRPMQERMTMFWHGHFCSGWDKVFSMKALASQNKVFRDNAAETLYVCGRSVVGPDERHVGRAALLAVADTPHGLDVAEVSRLLRARGCHRIFVEGGGVVR